MLVFLTKLIPVHQTLEKEEEEEETIIFHQHQKWHMHCRNRLNPELLSSIQVNNCQETRTHPYNRI